MFFRKKGKLRKEKDSIVLQLVEELKNDWLRNKKLVDKSIEPSEEILHELYLSEVRYFYALREAKIRKVSIR